MLKTRSTNPRFIKACWVVPDIRTAVDTWLRTTGIGPFFLFEKVMFDEPRYRGRNTKSPDITAAMAQAGDLLIELVAQNDDQPSFFRDIVAAGRTGLHHMAVYCEEYDADLRAYLESGAQVAFSGRMMGSRVAWLELPPGLGFMVELIEKNDAIRGVFDLIRSASEQWDGEAAVRSLA